MTMVRTQWQQLLAPALRHLFIQYQDLAQRKAEYDKFCHIETSRQAYEDEVEIHGIGPMQVKPEGQSVVYTDAVQGGTKRYLHTTWALGMRASWELMQDDQYGVVKQMPKALARSAHFVIEQQACNIFNLGFTSVVTTDGVSLFNTQHPLVGGPAATTLGPGVSNIISAAGTYPNRPNPDLDLSVTALQLALNQYERAIDSMGIPVVIRPELLVIPPELRWIAKEILGSPQKPYTSDNEINALIDEGLRFAILHFLTSQSAWFLLAGKETHTIKFFWRNKLDEDSADDFDTRSVKHIAWMRFAVGATSWIGTWGSNGP